MKNNPITVFGEVLSDHFPDDNKVLGGAPFNVAWHLQAFGQKPQLISRVGNDLTGNQIRTAMQIWGMNLDYLQTDSTYPTGQVQVTIEHGEPAYSILANQAYDHIQMPGLNNINHTGILYHGTLAVRSPRSRQTLAALKALHQGKIFIDVNLRQPWWSKADVLQLINDADWVKLNLHELHALQDDVADIKASMEALLSRHELEVIIVTCSEEGALALNNTGEFSPVSPISSVDLIDTVGAGDAFSAILLLGFNLGWTLGETMERAQSFASAMTGQRGATVDDLNFYKPFVASWLL
ncbi:carbohydrate kinase family protein [Methyloglobulus sp.]|uniref:carbohydrate kinase family protein n=1 Tax=Methyloglobulus sp. TaxID=2518622 RepID=UPI00398998CE